MNIFDTNNNISIKNVTLSVLESDRNLISDVPTAVFSSLIALLGIFFAAILITFSLDYLPRHILMKYSFYRWQTYSYISYFFWSITIVGFLSIQKLSTGQYYIILVLLILGIIGTIKYFLWFAKRISKKEIYGMMKKTIEEDINKIKIKPDEEAKKEFERDIEIEWLLDKELKEKHSVDWFETKEYKTINAQNGGIIEKIDYKELKKILNNIMEESRETDGFYPSQILHIKILNNSGDIIPDKKNILFRGSFFDTNTLVTIEKEVTSSEDKSAKNHDENLILDIQETEEKTITIEPIIEKYRYGIIKCFKIKNFDHLDDFFECLKYRSKKTDSLDEELDFLKELALMKNDKLKEEYIKAIFYMIDTCMWEWNDANISFISSLIYKDYEIFWGSIDRDINVIVLKHILANIRVINTILLSKPNKNDNAIISLLNLNISELISYDFKKYFIEEKNEKSLYKYEEIINAAIIESTNIVKGTIEYYNLNPVLNEKYLKKQLQGLINLLEDYSTREEDILQMKNHYEYYSLKMKDPKTENEKKRLELMKNKIDLITTCIQYKNINLAYISIYGLIQCENEKLPHSLVKLFLSSLDIVVGEKCELLFDDALRVRLMHDVTDDLHPPQAYDLSPFKIEKYIILYLIHRSVNSKEFTFEDTKLTYLQELINEIKKYNRKAVKLSAEDYNKKWSELIGIGFKEYSRFKGKIQKDLNELKKLKKEKTLKNIADLKLDSGLIEKFKEDVRKEWNENTYLRNLIKRIGTYTPLLDKEFKDRTYFGRYFVDKKYYFVKDKSPFDVTSIKPPPYGRDIAQSESDVLFSRLLDNAKEVKIKKKFMLNEIIDQMIKECKEDHGNLAIVIRSVCLHNNLDKKKNFKENYELSETFKDKFKNCGFLQGSYMNIPVFTYPKVKDILVIDLKRACNLVQYKSPFSKKENENELSIEVNELTPDDIESMLLNNKKLKKVELKTNIKIRIAEKFDFEIKNKNAILRYRLSQREEKKS